MMELAGNLSADEDGGKLPAEALPLAPVEDGVPVDETAPEELASEPPAFEPLAPEPLAPAPAFEGAVADDEHAANQRATRGQEPRSVRIGTSLQSRAYASDPTRQRECFPTDVWDLTASPSTVSRGLSQPRATREDGIESPLPRGAPARRGDSSARARGRCGEPRRQGPPSIGRLASRHAPPKPRAG